MYEPLLFLHSWLRWLVLLGLLWVLVKQVRAYLQRASWSSGDSHLIWAVDQIFGYQVLFGLTLWAAFSPISKAGFRTFSSLGENPFLFFWTLRHPLTMIAALLCFQIGKALARSRTGRARSGAWIVTVFVSLALILSAIPWPGLAYGRALLRGL